MKKLLVLTVIALLTASAAGCHHCFMRRQAPAAYPAMQANPCCDPCATSSPGYGDSYLAPPPAIMPGPIVQ